MVFDKENAKFWCVFVGKTHDALQMQMDDENSAKQVELLQKNKSRIEKTFYA